MSLLSVPLWICFLSICYPSATEVVTPETQVCLISNRKQAGAFSSRMEALEFSIHNFPFQLQQEHSSSRAARRLRGSRACGAGRERSIVWKE